jgi:flagellar biosynthesis protein FlhG
LKTQADKLKELLKTDISRPKNTRFIAITSGKGGVGKTTITANLGYALYKLGFKVALFDADIGLANLDVILKVNAKKNIYNVLKNECSLKDIIVEIEKDFVLIPGKSGDEIMNFADETTLSRFFNELEYLDDYDFFIIDTGAGIDKKVQMWLEGADDIIVITVPEPAAITDAYAMIKIIRVQYIQFLVIMFNMLDTVFIKIIKTTFQVKYYTVNVSIYNTSVRHNHIILIY